MSGRILPGCRAAASAANSACLTVAGGRTPTGPCSGGGERGNRAPGGAAEHSKALPGNTHNPFHIRGGANSAAALLSSLLPVTDPARVSTHGARPVSCRSPARPALHPRSASSLLPVPARPALHPRSVSSLLPITGRGNLRARSLSALLADPRAVEALYQGASGLGAGLQTVEASIRDAVGPSRRSPTPPAPPGAFRCPVFVPARVARSTASSPRHPGRRGLPRCSP